MSWSEIAEVVGRKPAAMRKRHERLKARLREQAEAAGLLRRYGRGVERNAPGTTSSCRRCVYRNR